MSSVSTQDRRWRTTTAPVPATATVANAPRPTHFHHRTAPIVGAVTSAPVPLDEALSFARTGDLWLFRGRTVADRAIHVATNSPINHVGIAVVIDDLPPLIWHAALDRKLVDVWSAAHVRGTQLNRLDVAARRWYDLGNRVWVRAISPDLTDRHERLLLETIEETDGRGFPGTASMARRWLVGRARRDTGMETAYCAEVVASTYIRMGLLPANRPANWYDPGRFWSGDGLDLLDGFEHEPEVEVLIES